MSEDSPKAFAKFKHKNKDKEHKTLHSKRRRRKTTPNKINQKLNIAHDVVSLSNIPSKQLRALYSLASIYVLPSKAEDLPLQYLKPWQADVQ